MKEDSLVILIVALLLFALFMFLVSFTYFKKYCNERRLNDDYKKEINREFEEDFDEEELPKKKK